MMNADQSFHFLARAFVGNRHLLVLSIVIILVGGWSAYSSLPRLEDPVISNRAAQIKTFFPGATAARVEALISEPLEQRLKEISAIKHIDSTSRTGISVVAVELVDGVDEESNDAVFSEIRDKVNEASSVFPEEALPSIFDDKRNAVAYTMITALRWADGAEGKMAILNRQAEELADRLRAVSGTDLVRLYGAPQEEIRVEVDPEKLNGLGMTIGELANVLRRADAKVAAGQLQSGQSDLVLEVGGNFESVERVRNVVVRSLPRARTILVRDVAAVQKAWADPPRDLALRDGMRCVLVAARVESDQRVDLWADQAKRVLAEFRQDLGGGIAVEPVFDQDSYTSRRLGQLGQNLLLGAGVVLLVVFVTMGWRASWIIGTALPLTAGLTLFVVAFQGGKLHQMSIFGMIIALGLLIDNAIVMTDEVRRYLKQGLAPVAAASHAIRHLFWPLLSSTLTTVLAFVPILLLPGNAGDFVSSISTSVIVALSASFVVAMTVIPALAGLYGKVSAERRGWAWLGHGVGLRPAWSKRLLALLQKGVESPVRSLAVSLPIPLIGFALATTLGSQFFPRTDRNMFEIEVRLPESASLERTRRVAEAVEGFLFQTEGVQHVAWLIGGSYPSVYYNLVMNQDGAKNYAHGIVTADDFEKVSRMVPQLQQQLDYEFPEAQVLLSKFAQGPPADADVEFRLVGPDVGVLQDLGEQVRVVLGEHADILHTRSSVPRGEPKLWFEANENALRLAGLSLTDVSRELDAALAGVVGGTVLEDVEELPVRVRRSGERRDQAEELGRLNLQVSSADTGSRWAPLMAFGDLKLRPEQGGITRRDGARVNKIYGYARSGSLPIDIAQDVLATLPERDFVMPPGYRMELGGESENQAEALGNLGLYLPVIVVLTIAILVLTFRSVRIAVILLVVAPLSVGFGMLATWCLQFPLSFNSIIGSLGLMGLAFNSSIVVIAAIRQNGAAASGEPAAIAGAVAQTSRHLLSTTLTTIGSFLPLLILIGGQFWPPLAIVLVGGVGGSTFLALTLTPALYALFFGDRGRDLVSRFKGGSPHTQAI